MSTAFVELDVADPLLVPVLWLAWSRKELYASSDDMALAKGLIAFDQLRLRTKGFEADNDVNRVYNSKS